VIDAVSNAIPNSIPRAALVTGGRHQHAIATALRQAGFAVAVQYPPDEEEPLAGVLALRADLTDEAQTAGLIARAMASLSTIGVLINAATTPEPDSWADPTRAAWDRNMETNLRAPFVLIRQFAESLNEPHEGVVINLLDQQVSPRLLSYTLSQAGLWTLTRTLALALAPRIRVNGIARSMHSRPDEISHEETIDEQTRAARADAVARAAIAILALPSMTGQMIVPDGLPRARGIPAVE
jgi:NAD(P)-dependent dehydrogenase (short-subunit alcohol dehydrogenase family)